MKMAMSINNAGNIVGLLSVTARGDTEEHAFVLLAETP
jgi:hypothetical protein